MTRKKTLLLITTSVFIIGIIAFVLIKSQKKDPVPVQKEEQTTQTQPTETQNDSLLAFDKKRYSLEDPNSLWVVANKKRPLPNTFVPQNLTSVGSSQQIQAEAATALNQLMAAAGKNQVNLRPLSGYRSFDTQKNLYTSYVMSDGQANADTYSARAGHSEHQTGLAIDVGNGSGQCDLEICFANTAGGKWVAANAHTYGFIIRYLDGKTSNTGYQYEPWHLRYVGVDLANELYASKQTMEEFFGLPAAPSY